ncbi:hypothetical protein ACFL5M_05690 [Candidatus Neomarinimicrobiota bacterium]
MALKCVCRSPGARRKETHPPDTAIGTGCHFREFPSLERGENLGSSNEVQQGGQDANVWWEVGMVLT